MIAPLVIALAMSLSACTGENTAELLGSAKAFLAKDDPKSAIIQLKSALQSAPESAEGRFLLGRALLATGDASGAIVELTKALQLKHPDSEVVPELARALMFAGEFQRLTEQFAQTELSDPIATADLKSSLAAAYGAMGRRDLAERAVDAALKAMPDYGPAKIFQARLMADSGELDAALVEIGRVLARSPQDHDAWQVQAELLNFGKQDVAGALNAYRQAAAVKPDFAPAHAGVLAILLSQRDLNGAKTQLEALKKVLPNHPQTRYYEANIALLSKDLDSAQEISNQLLRMAPDNPRILQLAGAVAFERGEFAQADLHLSRALQVAPGQTASRHLLALSLLRTSQPGKALLILQPLLERPEPGAQTYSLVAQAHLQAGDVAAAEANFAKASKLDPSDTRSRASLAVSRLVQGDSGGIGELRSIAAADSGTAADLPLISALVRQKDYAGALKAIDALEKKLTGPQPMIWNLRARVHLRKGDAASARQALLKALEVKPSFFPAAAALAGLDLAEKKVDDAKKRFDDVLAADPGNTQALLASAALKQRTGAPREEVLATFANAIKQNPSALQARLALVNYHLTANENQAALAAAQQGAAALPNSPEMMEALGRAQLAAGDTNQAIASFNKLTSMQPGAIQPLLLLAEVQAIAGNRAEAIQQYRRAMALDPESLQAQRGLADQLMIDGRHDEAVKIARQIQDQRPKQETGYMVESAIHAGQKQWDPAITALRTGLKAVPKSTILASRLHATLVAAGRRGDAERLAAQWLRDHARDAAFIFYLGDAALMQRDNAAAEARYREVLKLQPDNPLALNNVAWLMALDKKRGALELAEKANQLLPNRPTIMDTLALALSVDGQNDKAVQVLRQALSLSPGNATLRFNLAKMLVLTGDKQGARAELEGIAKLGDAFPRQGEVSALLKTL
jgi:putative PEP-CTERM system TPR-repeat lipoprotein